MSQGPSNGPQGILVRLRSQRMADRCLRHWYQNSSCSSICAPSKDSITWLIFLTRRGPCCGKKSMKSASTAWTGERPLHESLKPSPSPRISPKFLRFRQNTSERSPIPRLCQNSKPVLRVRRNPSSNWFPPRDGYPSRSRSCRLSFKGRERFCAN